MLYSCVDVTSKIRITVAHQIHSSGSPAIAQTIIQCAGNIPQNTLDRLKMFLSWLLHEAADEAHGERQIRSGMYQVA